jgi:hypothetical protein
MTTIQIDDRTAEGLAAMAHMQGVTVQVLLASLVQQRPPLLIPEKSIDFDAELSQLSFHGPSLPADFSRADIYTDRG